MEWVIELDSDGFKYDGYFVSIKKVGASNDVQVTNKVASAYKFTDLKKASKVALKLSSVGKIGSAMVFEVRGNKAGSIPVVDYYKGKIFK